MTRRIPQAGAMPVRADLVLLPAGAAMAARTLVPRTRVAVGPAGVLNVEEPGAGRPLVVGLVRRDDAGSRLARPEPAGPRQAHERRVGDRRRRQVSRRVRVGKQVRKSAESQTIRPRAKPPVARGKLGAGAPRPQELVARANRQTALRVRSARATSRPEGTYHVL